MALFEMMTTCHKESKMKTRKKILAVCLLAGLTGCSNMSTTEQRTLSGAAIGTAGGALIGSLNNGRAAGRGALIGAAAGALGGWLYDKHEKSEGN
jgi:uncharacterized protein YcfJ